MQVAKWYAADPPSAPRWAAGLLADGGAAAVAARLPKGAFNGEGVALDARGAPARGELAAGAPIAWGETARGRVIG